MRCRLFLFGESERGTLCSPKKVNSLVELSREFGNPTSGSRGIECAIQALLAKDELIFFRVSEEGYSHNEYLKGVDLLKRKGTSMKLTAISLPGVGSPDILDPLIPICKKNKILLILSEGDLYDYLTESKY